MIARNVVAMLGWAGVFAAGVLGWWIGRQAGVPEAPGERPLAESAPPANAACPHGLAAERCPFCTPALVAALGFCAEHQTPEALCHRCNGALIEAFKRQNDWCAEHDAPESLCPVCRPGAGAARMAQATATAAADRPMTGSEAADASGLVVARRDGDLPERPAAMVCETERLQVRLGPTIEALIGLRTETVERRTLNVDRSFLARTDYDRTRWARVAARAPGVIERLDAEEGQRVRAGEVIAVLDSAEMGRAKAEWLSAVELLELRRRDFEREQRLLAQGIAAAKSAQDAATALREAEIAAARARRLLLNLGLSELAIERVGAQRDVDARLPIEAPMDGVVVRRHAVPGETVDALDAIVEIADPSTMWVWIDVPEGEAALLRPGLPVQFVPDGMPDRRFVGTLAWIPAEVDVASRMVRARAVAANPDGALRAYMFGRAEVRLAHDTPTTLVPRRAIQWDGCCYIVFVRLDPTLYVPRKVTLGRTAGDWVEAQGVAEGEAVATDGAFLLKTEIMKGAIGAGCCEPAPGADPLGLGGRR